MKVALIQLNSTSDMEKNYKKFLYFLELSKANKADLVIFPENTFYIGKIDNYKKIAEKFKKDYLPEILNEVKSHGLDIILGGVPFLKTEKELVNRLLYINSDGVIEKYYDKIHLFQIDNSNSSLNEAAYLTRGNEIVTIEKHGFILGFSICYDLRFPEIYRALIDRGANVLIIPAAFTYKTGKLHWVELLRARAIENQSYVFGVNQVGEHENYGKSYGVTSVVKPVGEIISLNDTDEDVLFFDLIKSDIEKFRHWIPALDNRVKFKK